MVEKGRRTAVGRRGDRERFSDYVANSHNGTRDNLDAAGVFTGLLRQECIANDHKPRVPKVLHTTTRLLFCPSDAAVHRGHGPEEQRVVDVVHVEARRRVEPRQVWGTGDPNFGVEWAYRFRDAVPGVTEVVEVPGAKLFFPDERPGDLLPHLRRHWA